LTIPLRCAAKDPLTALNIKALREEIAHYCALGARVIDQARRRVLEGEQVPTSEKTYSIFEPHTDLIKRGKVRTPVEFGHKVFLAESAGGLITQYEVLKGNPVDEVHVAPSIRRHHRIFRRAPALYGADRGFFSESNIAVCARGGVAMVSIPQRGGRKTPQRQAYERSLAFKQGQRFRAGIEGRISVLMRGRGMKRCRAEGAERFALFVGSAVLANNLIIIGELLTKRSRRRRKTKRQASRLARNGRDWHTLLEFCGLVNCLIMDEDGIYDPRLPNDRLVLGMKGTMSEMELSIFRKRVGEDLKVPLIF
jgi:transposase, IS5 family